MDPSYCYELHPMALGPAKEQLVCSVGRLPSRDGKECTVVVVDVIEAFGQWTVHLILPPSNENKL